MLSFKPAFPVSYFTFIKRLFSSSSLSVVRVVSSAYLRLLIFLPKVLIPACASSIPVIHIMYSAYKLNRVTVYSLYTVLISEILLYGAFVLFCTDFILVCASSRPGKVPCTPLYHMPFALVSLALYLACLVSSLQPNGTYSYSKYLAPTMWEFLF